MGISQLKILNKMFDTEASILLECDAVMVW